MKKLFTIFSICLLLVGVTANAQVKIGAPAGAPAASAILDLSNTDAAANAKKGFLGPQVSLSGTSDATTVPSPATGLMVYNTTAAGSGTTAVVAGYYYFNGTQWVQMVSSAAPASGNIYTADGTLTAPRTVSMGTNALNFTGASGININTTSTSAFPLSIVQPLSTVIGQPGLIIAGASGSPATSQVAFIGFNPNASQGTAPIGIGAQYINGSAGQGAADFFIGSSSGGAAAIKLVVQNGGNVGIGTTAPNAPLQFANTTANRKLVLFESTNNDNQFYGLGINNSMLRYQVDAPGATHAFFAGTGIGSSNELMRIQGNGNVGIGTSTPAVALEVVGQLKFGSVANATSNTTIFPLNVDGSGNVLKPFNNAGASFSGSVNAVANAATVNVSTLTSYTPYKVIISLSNSCGYVSVAEFIVEWNVANSFAHVIGIGGLTPSSASPFKPTFNQILQSSVSVVNATTGCDSNDRENYTLSLVGTTGILTIKSNSTHASTNNYSFIITRMN